MILMMHDAYIYILCIAIGVSVKICGECTKNFTVVKC